jgi:LuxR family transcriptional regulator, maltose regulon positive regulatory protein
LCHDPALMPIAKTTRPTLARTLARPRLFRLLDRAGQRPVTWVWALPGAGKTTMVASYLAARRRRALWYQADAGDADVATFFYYLGRAAPRRGRPLPLLTAEYRQGLAVFARRFFRELYSRLPAPFTLVFDNYQDVPADSELHEVMAEAIAEIPEGVRLLFISRAEPPRELARHRALQRIEILEWPDLRLTPAEADGLVRRLVPGKWSRETMRALHERADGWCAGLILQLDRLRSTADARQTITLEASQAASEVLFDYFAGEIFKQAAPHVQHVLLQTAFLPRVTASMATALTEQPAAAEILATLHRQNYFTDKQAGREPSYQYHPLFRQFLLSRAERAYSADALAKIRRRAADLLDGAGETEAAAGLLRDARDWDGLAWLVHRHAATFLAQGRAQTVEDWLAEMPASIIEEQPWLRFWRGIGTLGSRHVECQRDLEGAFHSFRRLTDTLGMLLAWSGIIFAYFTAGEFVPMDRWIALLEEILPATGGFPSLGVETRVAVAMLCAITMRQPHHPEALRWAGRAIELVRGHPDPSLRAIAAGAWIHFEVQRGDVTRTAALVDDMRAYLRNRDAVFAVNASGSVAWYDAVMGLPTYRRTVSEVLELSRTTGMFYTSRHLTLLAGIAGALGDGDVETAAPWLAEMEHDLDRVGPGFRAWYRWLAVWNALVRDDIARAGGHLPEFVRLAREAGRPLDYALAHLMSAHVLHARRRAREAHAELDHAFEVARQISSPFVEFMARLLQAHLHLADGRDEAGLTALRQAMAMGRERGYVSSFVWIPKVMARLCARALAAGIEVEYVRDLVRRRGLEPEEPPLDVEAWPWPIKIFTLGGFEVQRDGAPVRFSRKVQRKPLALLKTLIALGGRGVREDLVMDALWPEASGDAARMAFTSALHRLRSLLGHEGAVQRQEGQLSLDERLCWVDVWAVDRLLTPRHGAAAREDDVRKALDLYRGAFLPGDEGEVPQTTTLADALRRRLLRQITRVARHHEPIDAVRAAEWYEEGLRIDPCDEDVTRSLMNVYHRLGRRGSVADVYARCRSALVSRLGSTPSPDTERLFKTLSGG